MIRNIRCLLALPAILFTAVHIHAQTLSVSCTDPAGPNFPGGYESTCIASGGVAPYTSAIINGQLPSGLSLRNAYPVGVTISGQPTAFGPYAYTIQFTDSQNHTASETFSGTTTGESCIPPGVLPAIPQTFAFGTSGGASFLTFSLPRSCTVTVSADIPEVTITPSGNSDIQGVNVTIMPNPDPFPHVGNLSLKENGIVVQTFPISVNSSSCTFTVSPASVHISSAGGTGTYTITSNLPACVPVFDASTAWAQVSSSDPGMYSYFVEPDFGVARTTTVLVGSDFGVASGPNATLTFTQDGDEGNGSFVVDCLLNGVPREGAAFPAVCFASPASPPYYTWSLSDNRAGSITDIAEAVNFNLGNTLGAGHYHFTVTATNASGPTPKMATYTLDGEMFPALLGNSCTQVAGPSQVGSGFGIACVPSGGTPPYVWSISAGALPTGLTLALVPGGGATISGVPANAGSYSFTIQRTDSGTPTAMISSQVIAGYISPAGPAPTTLSVTCNPNVYVFLIEVGMPMPPNLCTAGGGIPPYTWSIHSGSLPDGLMLGPSSVSSTMISGTPTSPIDSTLYLKVTDSSPNPQSIIWSPNFTITNPVGMSCPGDGPSLIGQSYVVQCSPTGGGYSWWHWWVSAGTLPPGLTLTTAPGFSLVSGTPTTPGPYSYTISVADGLTPTPATASQTFTGVITPFPPPLDTTKVSGSMAHLAIGDGWSTTTVLMNAGPTYAQAHVSYFADDGSPLSLTTSTTQIMPPHATFVIDSAPPTSAPLQEGSANLSTDGDVNGFIRFRYAPRDQEAIVPLETRKAGAYLLAFDNTNGIATGVALANLTTGAATIPVVIRDNTGAQLSSSTVQLSGKSHTAFVLSDRFTNVANLSGTVEFDTPSGGQISVLGIRFPPGQRFTTIPVVANTDPGGGSLAHLAVGDGWTTTVELINFGATSAQTHLKFFADDGTPLALPLTFAATSATTSQVDQSMPPHSRLVIQSNALDTDPLATGSAQLTSDGSVSGFIRFRYAPRDQEAIVPLESRNAASYILSFDNTNGLVAGVAVANLSPTTAAVIPVIIRDSTGAQLGSSAVTLAPNAHTSFVLSGLFNSTVNQTGTVEFDAPEASPISVLGFRFPASGAFSTIPVLAP